MGRDELKEQLLLLKAACEMPIPDIAAIRCRAEDISVTQLDARSYPARKLRGIREEAIMLDADTEDFQDRLLAISGDIRMLLASFDTD